MSSPFPYLVTSHSITLIIDNKSYIIDNTHPNASTIRRAIKEQTWDLIPNLVDIPKTISTSSGGKFEVKDDVLVKDGEPLHNVVAQRILSFMQEGEDFQPLLNFLEKVSENPSNRSIEELYSFLEHKNLPIDADGCFYAYKAVRNDFKDKHSGTFDNSVGKICVIPRQKVNDDARIGCSYGLHVGSLEYVKGFANGYGLSHGDQIVIVKVNPRDVVSVPYDCNCQKVRVARYEVVGLFKGELPETTFSYIDNYRDDGWDDEFNDEIDDEENFWGEKPCPICGNIEIEEEDAYCRMCGAELFDN